MNLFEHAADIFRVAKANEKRQILSLLLSDLEFDGETINFTLLEPFDKLFKRQKGSVWQGFKDLILNPTKYILTVQGYNVESMKSVLERHGLA